MKENGTTGLRIAVLALQGAFIEHERMLNSLGAQVFEVRKRADWEQPKDGLVIPGGESTTMKKLLNELGLFNPIRQAIQNGLPVFGTCAGLILLSPMGFGTMDIDVVRNGYGRQLGSFFTEAPFTFPHPNQPEDEWLAEKVPMTFIRAPYINKVYGRAQALATINGRIVAARQDNLLATAFHPELNKDTRIHELFLHMVSTAKRHPTSR